MANQLGVFVRRRFRAPREAVFRAFTDPEELERWFSPSREIDPPHRLVFTWTWEPPDRHAGIETLVTVVLEASGDETEVVVTHDRFPTNASRDRHETGWDTTLDRLEVLLKEHRT